MTALNCVLFPRAVNTDADPVNLDGDDDDDDDDDDDGDGDGDAEIASLRINGTFSDLLVCCAATPGCALTYS